MIWNKEAFLKRVRNREDRAKMLIQMYFDDIPERLEHLSLHIREEDFESVSKVAHTIKGVAANLGGEQCQKSAGEIEIHGINNNALGCHEAFKTLQQETESFNDSLHEYLSTLSS